ncbi:hypothetical protein EYF80_031643 [Liparis tanakae]|uniref:Uncharacterized protein n=1 Tax=Liparis tanakae TaxID=230148 RepID=A0A4Z2GXX7_9TELE|nr:hypothetical protein EYF80_031643 [Liparis tanakae]
MHDDRVKGQRDHEDKEEEYKGTTEKLKADSYFGVFRKTDGYASTQASRKTHASFFRPCMTITWYQMANGPLGDPVFAKRDKRFG